MGLTGLGLGLTILVMVWSLPWKGYALWRAAQHRQLGWFIALLILNTAAILDIVYIFGFQKKAVAKRAVKKARVKRKTRKRR